MKRFVMGIDGGATKTHVMICDTELNKVCLMEGGASSHEFLPGGFDEAAGVLEALIDDALSEAGIGIGEVECAVFGLAGLDVSYQYDEMEKRIKAFLGCPFLLFNDAFLPILAGSDSGYGIGAINGTGFSVAGLDRKGNRLQIGGFHEFSDDFGGGKWYTEQVISAVYRYMYKLGEKSVMVDLVTEGLGFPADEMFMENVNRLFTSDRNALRFTCCKALHRAADEGDRTARSIIEKSVSEYSLIFDSMLDKLDFGEDKVNVVVTGSQFTRGSAFIMERLRDIMDRRLELMTFSDPPVFGAVAEALRSLGKIQDRKVLFHVLRENMNHGK